MADKLNPTEASSKLSKYCTLLRTFGEHGREGIVNLCVIASHNFIPEISEGNFESALSVRDSPVRSDLYGTPFAVDGWDKNQYHGGVVLTVRDCEEGRKACYVCLLSQIAAVRDGLHGEGLGHVRLRTEGESEVRILLYFHLLSHNYCFGRFLELRCLWRNVFKYHRILNCPAIYYFSDAIFII